MSFASLRNAMWVFWSGMDVTRFSPSQQFGNMVRDCQSPWSTQAGKPPVALLPYQKMLTVSFLIAFSGLKGRADGFG